MEMATAMVLTLAVASLAVSGSAQQVQTCASKLISCASFLNSTSPPESCCGPLRDALPSELPCLCAIFSSPDILKAYHVDLNSAMQLPKSCGVPSFSTNAACVNATATQGGDKSNASRSAAGFGPSSLLSLLLLWWSVLLHVSP